MYDSMIMLLEVIKKEGGAWIFVWVPEAFSVFYVKQILDKRQKSSRGKR